MQSRPRGVARRPPGVDLGMPSLEGVRAMLLVQRFKSGFFDFYRLAAPLSAPAGCRATPCSLVFFYVSFAD